MAMIDEIRYFDQPTTLNSLAKSWAGEYRANRYLRELNLVELNERTADIASNLLYLADDGKYHPRFLVRPDRIYAPIRNLDFLRMATDVYEERRLRGPAAKNGPLDPQQLQIAKRLADESWCRRPDWILGSRLSLEKYEQPRMLFRFGKAHRNLDFINSGIVRITPASTYIESKINAVRDDELRLHWHDENLVRQMAEVPDYYALCLSSEYDYRLYLDFLTESYSCVAIKDPVALTLRMKDAVDRHNKEHPDSQIKVMYKCPVIYVDPFLLIPPETEEEVHFCKHFRFAYQTEFRYVLIPLDKLPLQPFFLDLGSLKDIAEIVIAPEGSTHV